MTCLYEWTTAANLQPDRRKHIRLPRPRISYLIGTNGPFRTPASRTRTGPVPGGWPADFGTSRGRPKTAPRARATTAVLTCSPFSNSACSRVEPLRFLEVPGTSPMFVDAAAGSWAQGPDGNAV